jgi:hypothetical protein
MIPFLVKLANLLDNRGQHSMAREVDDLIEKIAQQTWRDAWMENHQKLKPMLLNLQKMINAAAYSERLGNAAKLADQKIGEAVDWIDGLSKETLSNADIDEGNQWGTYLEENVYSPIQKIIDAGNVTDTFTNRYYELKDAIKPVIMDVARVSDGVRSQVPKDPAKPQEQQRITDDPNSSPELSKEFDKMNPQLQPQTPGAANKAPAKNKRAPSAQTQQMVAEIQKNLGMPQTGQWDKATNKKFIEMMNSQPEYAKMMAGGKFQGNLQKAVQMTGLLAELNKPEAAPQQGAASKAPATPAPATNLKSKYDLLDVQDEINRLRTKGGWGDEQIQALIGLATDAADKTPGDAAKKSESFEKNFKQMGRYRVR